MSDVNYGGGQIGPSAYESYVALMSEAGETPLPLADWLARPEQIATEAAAAVVDKIAEADIKIAAVVAATSGAQQVIDDGAFVLTARNEAEVFRDDAEQAKLDAQDAADGIREYPSDRDGPTHYGVVVGDNGQGFIVDLLKLQPIIRSITVSYSSDRDREGAILPLLGSRSGVSAFGFNLITQRFRLPRFEQAPSRDRDSGSEWLSLLGDRTAATALGYSAILGGFAMPRLLLTEGRDRDSSAGIISMLRDRPGALVLGYDLVRQRSLAAPILRRVSTDRDKGPRLPLIEGQNRSAALAYDEARAALAFRTVVRAASTDRDKGAVHPVMGDGQRALIGYDEGERALVAPPMLRRRSSSRDNGNHIFPLLASRSGSGPLVVDELEGGIDLVPTRALRQRLEYHSPAEFLGPHRAFNVRLGRLFRYASIQEADGYVGDVRQRLTGSTAAIADAGDNVVDLIQYQGQSNAGDGSITGQLITGVPGPRHLIVTDGWYSYGDSAIPASPAAADFSGMPMPSYGGAIGQLPAALMVMAAYDLDRRDTSRRVPPMSVATNWRGSDQLDKFFPATASRFNHENALEAARRARAVARLYSCTLRHDFIFIQGEAGAVGDYYTTLNSYLDTVVPLYGTNKGSGDAAYKVFILQTNSTSSGAAYDAAALAQLRVGRERYAAGVTTLASVMYDGPLEDQAGPDIHGSVLGRMIVHERVALAREFVRRKATAFHPTWPVAGGMTAVGNVVTVPISLATGALALAIDTDRVAAVDKYGFVWSRPGGGGPTVSSVAISGTNILVTLSGAPASGDRLRYALDNTNPLETWAGGRGQIYATTDVASPFAARGFNVPATIRQPLVRFEETLS